METARLRQKLHQYIDTGDDKLLKLMYALAKEYNEEDDFNYGFTEDDIKEFDRRTHSRLNGESKAYSWPAAKEIIAGKREME